MNYSLQLHNLLCLVLFVSLLAFPVQGICELSLCSNHWVAMQVSLVLVFEREFLSSSFSFCLFVCFRKESLN